MESKTYVFNPESGTSGIGSNGILAMLPALMQRQGVDPGLIALLNNRGNGNGWGEDLFAILLLFILMGNNGMGFFGGNRCMGSNGQGGVVPMLNNDANTAVIMQAVQRNGFDVQSLATALNTSSDAVMAAINGLGQQICNLGNQMGMNANQILTAIMQGNNAIATQLAECCCKTNNAITAMDGNIKLAICQQTHAINDTANANALMLRDKAEIFLHEKLNLKMHHDKQYIQDVTKGVYFVGAVIKMNRVYLSNRTIGGLINVLRELQKFLTHIDLCSVDDAYELEHYLASVNSYFGFMAGKNEYSVKRRVIKVYCPSFFDCFSVRGRFDSVRLKKNFSVKHQLSIMNNYE